MRLLPKALQATFSSNSMKNHVFQESSYWMTSKKQFIQIAIWSHTLLVDHLNAASQQQSRWLPQKWKHCDWVMLWWNTLKYLLHHDLRREIFKCAHLKSLVIGSLSNASVGLGQDRPNYHSLLIRFLRWNTQFPSKYPVPWTLRLLQSKLSHGVESLLQNKVSAGPFTWKWLAHRSYFMARH